jgi:hypothetical protein
MTNLRLGVALLFLVIGCGEDGNSQPGAGLTSLNPPANIDAVSCHDIVSPEFTISTECSACCTQHGSLGATTYDGHCVCGNPRDDTGDSVCADQAASLSVCMACCNDAGFSGQGWGSSSNAPSTCSCHSRRDKAVCAAALSAASPPIACQTCCLNNGYLASGYTGAGGGIAAECQCIDP